MPPYINQDLFLSIIKLSKLDNNLNNLVDIYISGSKIKSEFGVNISRENILLPIGVTSARRNIILSTKRSDFLSKLSGLLILYISKRAVYAVIITAHVEVCAPGNLSRLAIKTSINMFTTVVIPLGIAFDTTFMKNLPLTLNLFGSNANINAGIPIVKLLINVIWIGIKGYA